MKFRFDCISYYTADLDRAVDFYTKILGFEVASRDVVARFVVDGVLFELVPATDDSLVSGRGNARLVLAVDDINAAVAHLARRGVSVGDVRRVENGWLAPFRDPDQNELILWQYA